MDYWATVELILCPCLQQKWSKKTHFTKSSFFTHQKQLQLTLWGCRKKMYINCYTMHMHSLLHLLQHLAMDETLPLQTRCFPTIHSLILKKFWHQNFQICNSTELTHYRKLYDRQYMVAPPNEWLPPTQHFTRRIEGHVHKLNTVNFFSYSLTCMAI